MYRHRLARQPRAARQLPIAVLGADQSAQLAHTALIKGQRPPHLEIEHLEHWRIRPSRLRRCERHLDDRGGRKYRHSFDRMVADPGQHLLVEMIEPARYRAALAKTEKRVIERRIYRIGGLDRLLNQNSAAPKDRAAVRADRPARRTTATT